MIERAHVRMLPSPEPKADDLGAEIAAMESVARAVSSLPEAARERVLRWAVERYQLTALLPQAQAAPNAATLASTPAPVSAVEQATADRDLTLDGAELFGQTHRSNPATAPQGGVESLVHDFVSEFQRVAKEWQEG